MNSYTSADVMPCKLLQNHSLIKSIVDGYIPPMHVQLIPTNKCNLKCKFCSCAKEDKDHELSWPVMNELIRRLSIIGCKSVTITGGGEPLLYPQINELIARCYDFGIQVGLVTNGTLFEKLISRVYDTIVWCRISHSDERLLSNTYAKQIEQAIKSGPRIAWAFSYVVSKEPKIDNIKAVVKFAVDHGFTHVRLVADLTDPAAVPMDKIRESIKDPIVIIQDRASPEKGSNCYIAYLKPVISADGKIYRCCGAQYALDQGQKALPNELCMGELKDLEGALRNYTTATQGLQCKYCYYGAYNRVLQSMITKLTHEAFV